MTWTFVTPVPYLLVWLGISFLTVTPNNDFTSENVFMISVFLTFEVVWDQFN